MKKCATRKNMLAFRSGYQNVRDQKKNLFFSYGHRKCATRKKHHNEHRTNGRYPKKCATRKKNILAFKGGR